MIGRALVLIFGISGAAGLSQAPEMAQQYEQRLGGAIDELKVVVADFDADVAKNNLTRDEALAIYAKSSEKFLNDRGFSMRVVIDRLENLAWQKQALEVHTGLTKAIFVAQNADERIISGVWEDYEPGVPITEAGGIFAMVGAVLGWLVAHILRLCGRIARRPGELVG